MRNEGDGNAERGVRSDERRAGRTGGGGERAEIVERAREIEQ